MVQRRGSRKDAKNAKRKGIKKKQGAKIMAGYSLAAFSRKFGHQYALFIYLILFS